MRRRRGSNTRGNRRSTRARYASSTSRPSSIADLVSQQACSADQMTSASRIKHGLRSFIYYLFMYTGSLGILPMLFIAPSVGYLLLGWAGLLLLLVCSACINPGDLPEVLPNKDRLAYLVCEASEGVFDEWFYRKSNITEQALEDLLNAVVAAGSDTEDPTLFDKLMGSQAYRAYFIPDEDGIMPIDSMTAHFLPNDEQRRIAKIYLIKHAFKHRGQGQVALHGMRNFLFHLASDAEVQEKCQDFDSQNQNLSLVMLPDLSYKVAKYLRGGNMGAFQGTSYKLCHATSASACARIVQEGGFKAGWRNAHDDTEMVYAALMTLNPDAFCYVASPNKNPGTLQRTAPEMHVAHRNHTAGVKNPNYVPTVQAYAAQKAPNPIDQRFFFFTAKDAKSWQHNPHHIPHGPASSEADYVSFKPRKGRLRSLLLPEEAVMPMRHMMVFFLSMMFVWV